MHVIVSFVLGSLESCQWRIIQSGILILCKLKITVLFELEYPPDVKKQNKMEIACPKCYRCRKLSRLFF